MKIYMYLLMILLNYSRNDNALFSRYNPKVDSLYARKYILSKYYSWSKSFSISANLGKSYFQQTPEIN